MQGFKSSRVVVGGELREAAVLVEAGVIKAITSDAPANLEIEDFGNLVLMPGLVDTHVHINEPGRTEWEGYETATQAAAAGGITTVVDMPLNCIPVTTTLSALNEKLEAVTTLLLKIKLSLRISLLENSFGLGCVYQSTVGVFLFFE